MKHEHMDQSQMKLTETVPEEAQILLLNWHIYTQRSKGNQENNVWISGKYQ